MKVEPVQKSNQVTKETRRESYEKVLETLGERQRAVYELLLSSKSGMTAKELAVELFNKGLSYTSERNVTHPRLNELVAKGLVRVVGKKRDVASGRMVAVYRCN